MKIGIITVYDAIDNLGSYLQSYALKITLEDLNHQVFFIENTSQRRMIKKCIGGIRPIRSYHLRILKAYKLFKGWKRFNIIKKEEAKKLDLIIYGSDEIWNMDNPYFEDEFFFGSDIKDIRKIAYATSIGEMDESKLYDKKHIVRGLFDFEKIFVRDEHTMQTIGKFLGTDLKLVCDPTLLVDNKRLQQKIKLPSDNYILVYTYGIDKYMEEIVVKFARERNLKIVSPCFWHYWCDITVQCDPLQMSTLIKGAKYVFTTTFHGAIFSMINNKKMCVLPIRYKVGYVVKQLGLEEKIISKNITYDEFIKVICSEFPVTEFNENLSKMRNNSMYYLKNI